MQICKDILEHVNLASKSFEQITIIKDKTVFNKILNTIEKSANKALEEREETLKFIKSYKQ